MADVVVAVTAEEIEAEIIRSRLEAEGIPARIAPKSQIGMPGSWSPQGLGYGIGSFSVRVPSEYVRDARDVLREARPQRGPSPLASDDAFDPHAHLVVRVIATIVLLYLLIGTATWLAGLLPQL